jgi:hypothetical protein
MRLGTGHSATPPGLLAREALRRLEVPGRSAWCFERGLLMPAQRRVILPGRPPLRPPSYALRREGTLDISVPGRDRLIVPQHAAISVVTGPTVFTTGTTSINTNPSGTQANFLWVATSAFDGGFSTGRGVPTTGTFGGVNVTQLYAVSGGDSIANSFTVYGIQGIAGTADLVWTLPGSGYDGGPTLFYGLLAGVHQGAGATDSIRATVADNTLGSSVSLAAPAGNTTDDYPLVILRDFTDTTLTLSGCTQLAVSTVNSETIRPCVSTSTSAAAGASAGMSNGSGVRIHFIMAAAPGGVSIPVLYHHYRQMKAA